MNIRRSRYFLCYTGIFILCIVSFYYYVKLHDGATHFIKVMYDRTAGLSVFTSTDAYITDLLNTSGILKAGRSGIKNLVLKKECPVDYFKQQQTHVDDMEFAGNNLNENDPLSGIPTGQFKRFKAGELDESFINPCWYKKGKLQCLPYFMLAGVSKAASTDLYYKLGLHPQIHMANSKEQYFWTRRFFRLWTQKCYEKKNCTDSVIEQYTGKFTRAADCLHNLTQHVTKPIQMITGDGTPDTMADSFTWNMWPGNKVNKNVTEPRFVLAHYIRHYMPWTKFIFIVRNPTERLWSFYKFSFITSRGRIPKTLKPSPEDFHPRVVEQIKKFNTCLAEHPRRFCLFTYRHRGAGQPLEIDTLEGLYGDYIEEFIHVFPRRQIHIIRTEAYQQRPISELNRIYKFLGIDTISASVRSHIDALPRANVISSNTTMWPQTRTMLEQFYGESNKKLAKITNDEGYLWQD